MNHFKLNLTLFTLFVFSLTGCYYDVEEELYPNPSACDTSNVTYSLSVAPIISSNCYVCHSSAAAQGGVILEGYNAIKGFVDAGSLLGVIRHDAGYSPMPQGGAKLSSCNIATIEKWVSDGAPNN